MGNRERQRRQMVKEIERLVKDRDGGKKEMARQGKEGEGEMGKSKKGEMGKRESGRDGVKGE